MFKQNTDIIFKRHFYRQLAHIVIYFQLNVQLWFLSSAPPFSHFAPSHTTVTSSTFPSLPHAQLPSWLTNEVSQGQKCCRSWGWRITIFCLPLCSTRVSCCPPLRTLSPCPLLLPSLNLLGLWRSTKGRVMDEGQALGGKDRGVGSERQGGEAPVKGAFIFEQWCT